MPQDVIEPPVTNGTANDPAGAGASTTPAPVADPFALDETALASFSPEQRASLSPILDGWKKRASEEISKRETEVSQKYKPLEEKAQALDKLTNYKPFVEWWQAQQNSAKTGAGPQAQAAIQQTKPQDIATPQEWQEAIWEASNGDSAKLQSLQSRMFATWATPVVQQLRQEQLTMKTELAVKDLFERHGDAKELDSIGIDPKTKEGVSLLEMGLDWAERNGRSLEDGYALAKRWADQLRVGAQQQAMGMVQDKKAAVTASNSTANNNTSVVEVADAEELIRRSLESQLSGNKDVRFVIKGKS